MGHILGLEIKRLLCTKSTWLLVGLALFISVSFAMLVISFSRSPVIDSNGEMMRLRGNEAIKANRLVYSDIEGEVTPELIYLAFETYHNVYNEYAGEIPDQIYIEQVTPYTPLLNTVRFVYVNEKNGVPLMLYEISPSQAANFYADREARLTSYLSDRYDNHDSIVSWSMEKSGQAHTPFHYFYGIGNSDAFDYLTMCIFILSLICVVFLAPIFSSDYHTGADEIQRSTKYGHHQLAITRILSVLFIVAAIYLLCVGVYLTITNFVYGRKGLDSSMQLASIPYGISNLKIGGVQIAIVSVGLLSILAVAAFSLFLSSRLRSSLASLVISLGTATLPTLLALIGSGGNLENWVRLCLPSGGVGLANGFYYELTELQFLTLGSFFIWSPYIVVVAAALEIPIFVYFTVRSYVRHESNS